MPAIFYTKEEVDALIAGISDRPTFRIVELDAMPPPNDLSDPSSIVSQAGITTIALVTTKLENNANLAILQRDMGSIGDLIEIHCMAGPVPLTVIYKIGDSNQFNGNTAINVGRGVTFRKIAVTEWRPLSPLQ